MNVLVSAPAPALRLFVDKFWSVTAADYSLQGVGLPMLQTELVFNFSDHFSLFHSPDRVLIENRTTWISGLQTRPVQASTHGNHQTVGVLLKPWALQALTGVPASELLNSTIESPLLFSQPFRRVVCTVRETTNPADRLGILEQFLLHQYASRDVPAYLIYAVDYLQRQPWRDGLITDLANELRVSRKTLTLAFKKYIGLTPGRFLHLRLFNQLVDDLARNPDQKLTELAHRHRFFDQAHLNHLFKTFAEMTPGNYQKRVQAGAVSENSPLFIWQNG